MKPLSATAIKTIQSISARTNDELICKMCDHLLESKDDLENAMNVLIEDSALYKPLESPDLGELLIALSKEMTNKIMYKRPKR